MEQNDSMDNSDNLDNKGQRDSDKTKIEISRGLALRLQKMKFDIKETYEDVILRLCEKNEPRE